MNFIILILNLIFEVQQSIAYDVGIKLPNVNMCVYSHNNCIYPLKQSKSNDCWATVATMLLNWKNCDSITVNDRITSLGEPWISMYKNNKGLAYKDNIFFIQSMGLRAEAPQNWTLEGWQYLLKEYGPIWITTSLKGGKKGDILSPHAILLIGVETDGNYENSLMIFIDPLSGETKKQKAFEFDTSFELEARKLVSHSRYRKYEFRLQVLHW